MPASQLILASASPRRSELLSQIGVNFVAAPQDIDESVNPEETAEQLVVRLAEEKAQAALRICNDSNQVVLGSDTIVVHQETILGKPESEDEAVNMLAMLSNSEHRVLTAVCVANQSKSQSRLSESKVHFRAISNEEAVAYWRSGEPEGKAGGYAIQGLGAVFVQSLAGSYSGVMGLPLFETAELLQAFDIACWEVIE